MKSEGGKWRVGVEGKLISPATWPRYEKTQIFKVHTANYGAQVF
jgi:hypothetical protein